MKSKVLIRMFMLGFALTIFYQLFEVKTFQDYMQVTLAIIFTLLAARE